MHSHSYLLLGCLTLYILQISVQQCTKALYKDEAEVVLKIFGYSASCTTLALDACELGCKSDFPNEFQKAENSISEVATAVENALYNIKSLSRCFKKLHSKSVKARHCSEIMNNGDSESGIRIIYPYTNCPEHSVSVYCDQTTKNGGWTVIQRRQPIPVRENFNRNWTEYAEGFGKLTGEFWLGLNAIHELTTTSKMALRIELENKQGDKRVAEYDNFKIGDSSTKFKLISVGNYQGDANDSLSEHVDSKFSAPDSDNDDNPDVNRAQLFKSAWWFDSMFSNLNGFPIAGKTVHYGDGIKWSRWLENDSLNRVEMKIRPF